MGGEICASSLCDTAKETLPLESMQIEGSEGLQNMKEASESNLINTEQEGELASDAVNVASTNAKCEENETKTKGYARGFGPMYPRLNTARRELVATREVDDRDRAKAERRKVEGNAAVKKKHYETSIRCYSEAIRLNPKCHVYFSNRSMVHFSLGAWELAAKDAATCVVLEPSFIKGYIRLAAATRELNEFTEALAVIEDGLELSPDDADLVRLRKLATERMDGLDTQEARLFGRRPDGMDMSRVQKEHDEREALRSSGPSDPRDSGADMSLYQTPEYYDKQMELLPPEVRAWHLRAAETKMREAETLRPGSLVLDLCCGTGWASLSYARTYPGVFFIGVDNSEVMLQVARERAAKDGLGNVFFICADAETLIWNQLRIPPEISKGRRCFDAIISVFGLTVVPNWYAALVASWRMIRPGGIYAVLDLHFTKGDDESPNKDQALALKALPSQDHSRRVWDSLEQMPEIDEFSVQYHEVRQQYYCAIGRKKRFNPVDLEEAAFKIEEQGGEVIEGVKKWDPETGEDVPLTVSRNQEWSAPTAVEKVEPQKKLRPRGSSETIEQYYRATGGVCF